LDYLVKGRIEKRYSQTYPQDWWIYRRSPGDNLSSLLGWSEAVPELTITFDLPDFHDGFVWKADDDGFKALLVEMDELAQRNGLSLDALLGAALAQARTVLSNPDPAAGRGGRAMIAAFVLRLPTGHEDKPGLVGDYLGAYDFEVVFDKIADGDIQGVVSAHPRDAIAGSVSPA
jgi:hypothetical protein